jgi:hypothetical protein
MKALSIIAVALILGLGGTAMAHDSGANHQDDTNSTGPNPFMPEFSTPVTHGDAGTFGYSAYALAPVQHHVVHHHVKK